MYKLAEYRGKYCVYWRDPITGQPLRRSLGTDDHDLARSRFESFKQLANAREQSGHQLIRDWWKAKQKALGTRRKAENMEWRVGAKFKRPHDHCRGGEILTISRIDDYKVWALEDNLWSYKNNLELVG